MNDRDPTPPKNPARAAREKRLAEALRANLRRRKRPDGARASDNTGGKAGSAPRSGGKGEGG